MQDTDRLQLIALLDEIDEIGKHLSRRDTSPPKFFGTDPNSLDTLTKKQIALAKRLAGAKDNENQNGDSNPGPLVSIMSSLKGANKENRGGYAPTVLDPKDPNFIIPTDTSTTEATELWQRFVSEFEKLNDTYAPEVYQTVFALLHKYTARIQASPQDPDVSLYDFLRTTAAIAGCIAREELCEADIDAQLTNDPPEQDLCILLKGDISGIQSFLYQVLSDGAARQLRGRSFYLQLLTEAIAHWVLRQLGLPIVNLLLASGGHFYILAPYTKASEKLEKLQREISEKLWTLHQSDLSFILAGTPVTTGDFSPEKFSRKWYDVSKEVGKNKQKKWAELDADTMFTQLFKPAMWSHDSSQRESDDDEQKDLWQFADLGTQLRDAKHLIVSEVKENTSDDQRTWRSTMKAFGWRVELVKGLPDFAKNHSGSSEAKPAIIYRLGDADFRPRTGDNLSVSYDFRLLPQVIAYQHNREDAIADYGYLANVSDGVNWLGALRMDVDNLGTIFRDGLGKNATISRMATLSESLRLFFEGYVPQLCKEYNNDPQEKEKKEILELIYAGGDDLFLVGGWSALPRIAKKIRDEFRCFVTGNHVTLSGGIFIEHQKFPAYQFAEQSGEAEHAAKELKRKDSSKEKDAISFLQTPMSWQDFAEVSEWHQKFVDIVTDRNNPLPRDILTRLSQMYSDQELKGTRWKWRSLYYLHRMEERYKRENQRGFLKNLKSALNGTSTLFELRDFICVVTRWAALQTRQTKKEN